MAIAAPQAVPEAPSGPVEGDVEEGSPPVPAGLCPNCGSPTDDSPVCGQCRFLSGAADTAPVWEEQRWEIVVRPDRAYYEQLDVDGVEFPETVQSRRIPLVGDYLRIGRRSASRGIVPEIDLSGALEDVGVSHRHAVLMRQPGGDWALVDQGSTNGTYLNGELDPVPADQPLP